MIPFRITPISQTSFIVRDILNTGDAVLKRSAMNAGNWERRLRGMSLSGMDCVSFSLLWRARLLRSLKHQSTKAPKKKVLWRVQLCLRSLRS